MQKVRKFANPLKGHALRVELFTTACKHTLILVGGVPRNASHALSKATDKSKDPSITTEISHPSWKCDCHGQQKRGRHAQ